MMNLASLTVLLASAASVAHAGITQADFTGKGNLYVLKSDNTNTATPADYAGCLDNDGRFINPTDKSSCGVFTRKDTAPYFLTTTSGNCSFADTTQEKNTDSHYGASDNAFHCADIALSVYDQLYTIDGFNYVFLCHGDVDCFYDAKKVPAAGESISLWQFHWGSVQLGITPGHTQFQVLWNKV